MKRLAVAAVVLALLALLGAWAPAAAQQRASAGLALASQTAWVGESGVFTMRLDVTRVRRPQQLELAVVVHRAVTSRSQFARTIDGALLRGVVERRVLPFSTLRFDAAGAVQVPVDAEALRPGVYPVAVTLTDTGTDRTVASLVTHLVRVSSEPAQHPLNVAWVQPYGAHPALGPDGEVRLADDDLDNLRIVAAQLGRRIRLTVTPTPETVAALETIDEGATVTALAELLGGHQVLSMPYVDIEPSALVAAGREEDLRTQRVEGDAALDRTLALRIDDRTWSATGPVTRGVLRALHELGITRVVLDEETLEPLPAAATNGLTLTRPFALRATASARLDAVAVDPGLVGHLDDGDEVLGAHHLLADLAVLHADLPGVTRGVVIRPPVDWRPAEAVLATVLESLATAPMLQAVTIGELFDTVEPLASDGDTVVRELADGDVPSLGYAPTDLDRARAAIGGLGSLLVDPADADLALLDRLLLVAQSRQLSSSDRSQYISAVNDRVRTATANVRVLGERTYRLTAREGAIPLSLVNDNDFDVHVDIALTSDKLSFTGSEREGELVIRSRVLEAKRTTTEIIPVKARTSGQFRLQVSLRSPDGRLELAATGYTITSTVASGVGILLSVGAGTFLLLWWARHWRTGRRGRHGGAPQEAPPA
ncbi:MAG TPA: DUF6049 family protein [Acidimicrobiales bacterium]|nr:DUF6049 family protein [Acidimicrobiales bacterium]